MFTLTRQSRGIQFHNMLFINIHATHLSNTFFHLSKFAEETAYDLFKILSI